MKKCLIFLMILTLGLSSTACSVGDKSKSKEDVDIIKVIEHGSNYNETFKLELESISYSHPEVVYNVISDKYSKVVITDGVAYILNKDGEPVHIFSNFSIDLNKN